MHAAVDLHARKASWIAMLAVLSPAAAAAEPQREVAISWDAPLDCPPQARLIAEVERLIGRPLQAALQPHTRFHAVVERGDDDRWRESLEVRTASASATRTFAAPECETLLRATAVVVAMTIGERPADAPEPKPDPDPDPEPRLVPLLIPGGPRVSAPVIGLPPESLPGLFVFAEGGAEAAILPGAGVGGSAGAGVMLDGLRIEAGLAHWPARTRNLRDDAGARIGLSSALLRACAISDGPWPVGLGACAAVEGGVIRGEGFGITDPSARAGAFGAAAAEALAHLELGGPIALRARASLVFPLIHRRFVVENLGEVHVTGRIALRLALGIEVRFP